MHDGFVALRYRDFRWLFAGTLGSTAAQWIQSVTVGWMVFDLTGSGMLLGLVLGTRALPMILLAPVSGMVADRYSRKRTLLASQFLQMAACVWIAAVIALDAVEVWHFFVFMLVVSAGGTFDRTLRQTLVFGAVPREHVVSAVALSNVAFSVTRAISPGLGGLLLATVGGAGNFAVQALAYAFAAASAAMLRVPERTEKRTQSGFADLRDGLAYAAADPVTRLLLFVGVLPFVLLIPAFPTLLPIFASQVFEAGPLGLGLMTTAIGAGGTVGGLISTLATRLDRLGIAQVAGLMVFALAMLGVALSPGMALAIVFLFIAGVMEIVHFSLNTTMLQMSAPEHLRGRVTGLLSWNPAMIALSSVFVGMAADVADPRLIVGSLAATAVAITGTLVLRSSRLRTLRLSSYR